MKQKFIEQENPFVKGGKLIHKVERETKTRYVVRNNELSVSYFKKLPPQFEKDGAIVHRIPHIRFDRGYRLRIKRNRGGQVMASQLANDIIRLLKDSCEQIKNLKEENGKLESENRKLRYERLLARYRYFYLLAYHYACEGDAKDSKKSKCTRIAEAYEARAERIKETEEGK